jgi:hypothetical protein
MVVVTTSRYAAVFATGVVILVVGAFMALSLSGPAAGATPGAFAPDAAAQLGLDAAQLDQARRAMTVADEVKAPPLAVLAMVCAALGESNFAPIPNGSGSGYAGVFQADPANIPMDDTEGQARAFLQGGKGFQAGGAIFLATHHPHWSPGLIATMVEASGQPAGFYDAHRPQAEKIIAAWSGSFAATGALPSGATAKQVIDMVVLPICNANGITLTPAEVEAANATHGPTVSGGRSDHQGPPDVAWAADMSNGVTTPQEDALAAALAKRFGIPWSGSGLVSLTRGGYRFQLIYRTLEDGDHFNHVHFGVRVVSTG